MNEDIKLLLSLKIKIKKKKIFTDVITMVHINFVTCRVFSEKKWERERERLWTYNYVLMKIVDFTV
jgi:hypothetical protein